VKMAIQLTIIGLGQIGTSIGLGLANQQSLLRRVGNDLELKIARQAEKMGAVDQVEANLPKAVRNADLVLLCLPIDQIRETMEVIAPDLKENAVLMDTAPVKEVVASWASQLLPEGRHYVGLTPVLNPLYLHEAGSGIDAAHADLFHGGLMAIAAPPKANSQAIKLATDLTGLLGATPFFADLLEIDGLMTATHLLPQLMAAALLNATTEQPGWREARKVAGRAYAEASGPAAYLGQAQALAASALLNQANILRVLDNAIAALSAIRMDIEAQDDKTLLERLRRAQSGRVKWWRERLSGDWTDEATSTVDMPENPGVFGRLFGVGRKPKPKP
jgi:prephenate dehydrogenase